MFKSFFALSLFLFGLQIVVVWTDETPVLLWGANSSSTPALTLIRQNEFAELMKPLFEKMAVVAFLEPNLTGFDFKCRNKDTDTSCLASLEHVEPSTYYARVQSPVEALKTIAQKVEMHSVGPSNSFERPISCDPGKLTIINFDQSGNERQKQLQSHDAAIASISQRVKCPMAYLYMSSPNPKQRDIQDLGTLFKNPLFVLFFKNLTLVDNQNSTDIKLPSMNVNKIDSMLSVELGTELNFNVRIDQGYYIIDEFVFREQHYRAFEVFTPLRMSYFCGNLELRSNKTRLIWHSLQFQGGSGFNRTSEKKFKFYDAWHCVGFFTPPILSGIFVMIFLIFITSIGVTWIMDINSNDRFEDPSKEPIKINAED